jgi:hypothetical protein
MEAMQIRDSRETPRAVGSLRRSVVHLVAPAVAATMWLGAHPAFADSVSPRGDAFTATSTSAKFTVGPVTVTCTSSSTSGTVPATGTCGPITAPTFSGCSTNVSTAANATVLASGAWTLCVANNAGTPTATLTIPQRGVSASVSIFNSTCTATAAPDGPANVTGLFTNGTPATPMANPPSEVAFTSASVPISAGGSAGCPTDSTSLFTASYTVEDTTNPAAAITVGP